VQAQTREIKFSNLDIPSLIEIAKTSNKLIFIDVTATWCKPCKEMEITTFKDSAVSAFYNKSFICKKVYLDRDSIYKDSISQKIKNKTKGVPYFYFLDLNGNTIHVNGGLKTSIEFLKMGEKAIADRNIPSIVEKMSKQYADNKNDKSFLKEYIILRNKVDLDNAVILGDFLQLLSEDECLKDSIINIIIQNEGSIFGKGYSIISNEQNRLVVQMNSTDHRIGYNMYKASLDIISKNIHESINTKSRELLEKCMSENLRIRQDKDAAKKMNELVVKAFLK
jgi:thiol-disulfide isomerase/thioredoxin